MVIGDERSEEHGSQVYRSVRCLLRWERVTAFLLLHITSLHISALLALPDMGMLLRPLDKTGRRIPEEKILGLRGAGRLVCVTPLMECCYRSGRMRWLGLDETAGGVNRIAARGDSLINPWPSLLVGDQPLNPLAER